MAGMGDIFGGYTCIEPTGLADLLNLGKGKNPDLYLKQLCLFQTFFPCGF